LLEKKFPDASESWPQEASAGFDKTLGDAKWDFIGKVDSDRDGAPTGLLVGIERLPKTGKVIVRKLAVLKWQEGRWTELLRMDGGKGIRMDGKRACGLLLSAAKEEIREPGRRRRLDSRLTIPGDSCGGPGVRGDILLR
jgi:hypothetical protein